MSLDESSIVMTCGAAGGLNIILKSILEDDDEVILFAPFFGEYSNYIKNFNGKEVVVDTDERTFFPNIESLKRSIEKKKQKEGIAMVFDKLKSVIAEVLNVDPNEITMDSTFADDLGADSLDVFQIIMGIEEVFDIEVPAESAENVTTVEDAVNLINDAINQ